MRELEIDKNLIEDPDVPLRRYNYSAYHHQPGTEMRVLNVACYGIVMLKPLAKVSEPILLVTVT